MTQSIDWNTLTTQQKEQLIHTTVMEQPLPGHQCQQTGHLQAGTTEMTYTVDTYNVGGSVPPYTTSMEAAWRLLRHIADLDHAPPRNRRIIERFLQGLHGMATAAPYAMIFEEVALWTPERISYAAYQAYTLLREPESEVSQ